MQKVLVILGVLLAGLVAAIASDRPLPRADLTIIIPNDFFTLDPGRMTYSHDLRLSYGIYEQLVRWDTMGDYSPIPAAAESWTVSPDGRRYVFTIRPDARWSNGEPVTAPHYAYAWRRVLMPDTGAEYVSLLFDIKGGKDFYDWRQAQLTAYLDRPASERNAEAARALLDATYKHFEDTVGVKALDDRTLQVTLNKPVAYFLDLCAFGVLSPVYPPLLEEFSRLDPDSAALEMNYDWTKPEHIVTNGFYTPTVWRFKRSLRAELNPHHSRKDEALAGSVEFLPINDPNTSVLAYTTGLADWHMNLNVDYIPDMIDRKALGEFVDIHPVPAFGTYFWSFNCREYLNDGRPNPLHDPAVRRALAQAVDKEKIVKNVRRTGELATDVFVPPNSIPGFNSPGGLSFDPEKAREDLASAGWIDRDGDGVPENESGTPFPVINLLYSTGSYHDDIALTMGDMWKRHLGIRSKLVGKESKVYKDDLVRYDYMMARGGWFGDYGDPTTFLNLHHSEDGNNRRGYDNPEFDAMLEEAAYETDPVRRMRILEEAEALTMQEELPILPIFIYNWFYLYQPPLDENGEPVPGGMRGVGDHPRLVNYLHHLGVNDQMAVSQRGSK